MNTDERDPLCARFTLRSERTETTRANSTHTWFLGCDRDSRHSKMANTATRMIKNKKTHLMTTMATTGNITPHYHHNGKNKNTKKNTNKDRNKNTHTQNQNKHQSEKDKKNKANRTATRKDSENMQEPPRNNKNSNNDSRSKTIHNSRCSHLVLVSGISGEVWRIFRH